ncbi:response regulator transcription factor [Vibrio neptunius]|uniref:Response regulator transcription factor n=1 Tax=Vibrio neptunius TaxID=170651 RepID=A0ABS3A7F0_9VIBR|nr:response regulator transcription factor [Vibrio neptunius]MBN3495558.1 response regulator transcription factor [Vibrio neptunius]MBN3518036.1 response regulator transcription factor [Vibrio neptunius]MBN3552379.1 response regulator transcription factor [Vibrio neptunius]MBN3580401.1 response regulator transcription factor [Vibrio neptunius]MCH9874068.1 response regulator transcription factor [Vibrio neptunius]
MKLLLVEDNQEQADFLRQSFTQSGHQIDVVENGKLGLISVMQSDYDVIITDRMMPEMDGLQMVKAIRSSGKETPILILSALDSVEERVNGLRNGCDDYLVKPFAFSELLARVELLAIRAGATTDKSDRRVLVIDDLELDLLSRQAKRGNTEISFNNREFQILQYLMSNAGRVITRTMLLEKVWSFSFDPQTNVIDVHISRLRKKIDLDGHTPLLHTVRGAGYILQVKNDVPD